jgi:aquaporin Z
MSMSSFLREHWPEYAIECCALGCFMIAIGFFVTAFESPASPIYRVIHPSYLRTVLLASCIGLVLALLIHSPWGKRSGAHMNPAITLAFLCLKKVHPWDALFYVVAQTIGATVGVVVVAFVMGSLFTGPPVQYAVTLPGPAGDAVAFAAETAISFALMATVLAFIGSSRLIRFTGLAIGCLVALFIVVEGPLSGTSMNPARTLASALPLTMWHHLWLYLLGPTLGMLLAAQLILYIRRGTPRACAKLLHPHNLRCIHCGYCPAQNATTPRTL